MLFINASGGASTKGVSRKGHARRPAKIGASKKAAKTSTKCSNKTSTKSAKASPTKSAIKKKAASKKK